MIRSTMSTLVAVAAGAGLTLTAAALAQPASSASTPPGAAITPAKTGRENLARLNKIVSVDFKEWKLEDVMKHLATETDAVFEPAWKTSNEDGLDPEMLITFSAKGLDALTVLDKVLEKASGDAITSDDKSTWQLASYGAIQVGPRKALNKSKRVEVYDISDLLFEVPVYDQVPEIDLSQVLRSNGGGGGGGGGGSNIFGNGGGRGAGNQQRQGERRERRETLAQDMKRLLTSLAEKDQWEDNGGAGGTMTVNQGNLIVDAPDYMHRAIAGYAWLPSSKPPVAKGRRYVTMSGSVEAAKLIGLEPFQQSGGVAPGGTR